jgi:MoaA/NifB/PqqE/SkfB family radical SAM enzyme
MTTPLRPPSHQMLQVSSTCNLHCTYCFYEQGTSQYSAATLTIEEIDAWFRASGGPGSRLTITGGEPLLNPDLPRILELSAAAFDAVHLLTNGTKVDPGVAVLIASLGVSVDVSLDHTDLTLEDSVRGGTKQTLRGVERLLDAGVRDVSATLVLTRRNWTVLEHFFAFCRARSITAEVSLVGVAEQHPLSLRHLSPGERRELVRSLAAGRDVMREHSLRGIVSAVMLAAPPSCTTCAFAASSLFVDTDGSVYICPFQTRHKVGTVRDPAPHLAGRRREVISTVQPGSCVTLECFALARGA